MNNVSRETYKGVVFVVEGKNDVIKLKQLIPDVNVLITNGTSVSVTFLRELKELSKNNRVILLLDPDGPGEKIRKMIEQEVDVEHVFVPRKVAISKNRRKVGIEHMSVENLNEALKNIYVPTLEGKITREDVFELGFLGQKESCALREYVCNELHIGKANAKTFLKKLNMFGIEIEKIKRLVDEFHDRKL